MRDLEELASPSYQVSVWKEGRGRDVSSFAEFMCGFFDDDKVELFLKEGQQLGVLNSTQYVALKRVIDQLKCFGKSTKDSSPEEVLSHPQWHQIVSTAQQALSVFAQPR